LRREGGSAGYTLVELTVVLAILGLMLTIAVPLFGGHLAGVTLDAATREIGTALREARSAAITENRAVVFQGGSGGYWLDRRHFTLPTASGVAPVQIATGGGQRITFYPSGGSSGSRVLVTSGGVHREIAIDALTGRANVLR
jgi:general secretion pathway protein H